MWYNVFLKHEKTSMTPKQMRRPKQGIDVLNKLKARHKEKLPVSLRRNRNVKTWKQMLSYASGVRRGGGAPTVGDVANDADPIEVP